MGLRDAQEHDDVVPDGEQIRFMWDYTVRVPLWAQGELLADDPESLRARLGLSDELSQDLADWGDAMNVLDARPRLATDAAYDELDRRAHDLVARLRGEVGSRFRVVYRPWRRAG